MRKAHIRRFLAAALSLTLLLSLAQAAPAEGEDSRIDVWDFGAQQLDETVYHNWLTADEINSWYPQDVTPGTDGNTLPSFQSSTGIAFNDGGKPNTHRIRTTNTALTRKDDKELLGEDGTVYPGYIYSNSGKNPDVYVAIDLIAGDKVTLAVGSNGGESMIEFVGPSGTEDAQNFTRGGGNAQLMTFYPRETGTYRFWSSTEKLVIARIYREKAADVTVSGTVNELEGLSGHSVAFTNTTNGAVTAAAVENGSYTATLKAPFTYEVSLLDANGYVVSSDTSLTLERDAAAVTLDVTVRAVPLVTVTGKLTGLSKEALADLQLTFAADSLYVPQVSLDGDAYTAILAQGDVYTLTVAGINDYDLASQPTVSYDADSKADIAFSAKPTYKVTIDPVGGGAGLLGKALFTFTNLKEEGYVYTFTGASNIALRNGVYSVTVSGLEGYTQKLTSNAVIDGKPLTKSIGFEKITDPVVLPYKDTLTVGAQGCDYTSVAAAVKSIEQMDRPNNERVTVLIQPGNYEEMVVVESPNVTLKNASATPSLELKNKGVDIDDNAVRITHYYGCGYNYYSMNDRCKYDAELLAVNKENGYESFVNPGDGTDNDSFWNSTVIIGAGGFEAQGIIFENSFNQYVSPKSVEDVIVANSECKEDKNAPRAEMKTPGDTTVQAYVYKERAGALSIRDNCTQNYFENCKFIGRQDTLYGGDGTTAAFYNCKILGSTDYIYGPMTAVFAKCDLVFNTGESSEFDLGYITAPRHTQGRGFLMYNCTITSTTPGVDTASELVSKPGYLGRPWQANTGETVFYQTIIEPSYGGASLILPEGWLDSLSGKSALCGEYGSYELTPGVDNSDKRVSWVADLSQGTLADGSPLSVATYLGDWDPFSDKDMTIETCTLSAAVARTETLTVSGQTLTLPVLRLRGEDYVWVRDAAVALSGSDKQFNVTWQEGVNLVPGEAYVASGAQTADALTPQTAYTAPGFATLLNGEEAQLKAVVFTDPSGGGYTYYRLTDLTRALGL